MAKKQSKKIRNHKALYTIILLSFIAGVLFYLNQNNFLPQPANIMEVKNNTGSVALALSPSNLTLVPNQTTSFSLLIDTQNLKVSAAQIELSYNPAHLEIQEIKTSDFLPIELLKPQVKDGRVKFTYAVPPDSGGKAGTGTAATINVRARQAGTSQLSFTPETMVAAVGYEANVLSQATDTSINITTSTLSSPSPTLSSSLPTPSFLPENDYNYNSSLDVPANTSQPTQPSFFTRFLIWLKTIFRSQ